MAKDDIFDPIVIIESLKRVNKLYIVEFTLLNCLIIIRRNLNVLNNINLIQISD
jgi:hypothetical protein